jgi:hypothetical protein
MFFRKEDYGSATLLPGLRLQAFGAIPGFSNAAPNPRNTVRAKLYDLV